MGSRRTVSPGFTSSSLASVSVNSTSSRAMGTILPTPSRMGRMSLRSGWPIIGTT
jgi:hypothetical protein